MRKGEVKSMSALLMLMVLCLVGMFATQSIMTDAYGSSIDDIIKGQEQTVTQAPAQDTQSQPATTGKSNNDFIDSLANSMDYSQPESAEVKAFGEKVQKITSIIVQALVYLITAAMVISKVIDLFYIAIPLTRTFLANGYMGNGAAGGTAMNPGGTMGGMPGMGGGFGGGFGGGMGGRYGGMNGGFGMGGSMMDSNSAMAANTNQPNKGRIQIVSNAALNAVAQESVIGPDGKAHSAFKTYFKDMTISLIATPMMLVLCITGVISKLGFALGGFLGDVIGGIKF